MSGVAFGRRTSRHLDRRLDLARSAQTTYDHVGSTLSAAPPPGFRQLEVSTTVRAALPDVAAAMKRWAPHHGIGARVLPTGDPTIGATVGVVVPFGPVEMLAANRIVTVIENDDRYAVAYATLPGHPEVGEELFDAVIMDDRHVLLTIRAHSRPATPAARALAPLVALLQLTATRRYLRAWAADSNPPPAGTRG